MSNQFPDSECSSDAKETPLLLAGVSHDDVTKDFLRGVHQAADSEGLSLESISVETR